MKTLSIALIFIICGAFTFSACTRGCSLDEEHEEVVNLLWRGGRTVDPPGRVYKTLSNDFERFDCALKRNYPLMPTGDSLRLFMAELCFNWNEFGDLKKEVALIDCKGLSVEQRELYYTYCIAAGVEFSCKDLIDTSSSLKDWNGLFESLESFDTSTIDDESDFVDFVYDKGNWRSYLRLAVAMYVGVLETDVVSRAQVLLNRLLIEGDAFDLLLKMARQGETLGASMHFDVSKFYEMHLLKSGDEMLVEKLRNSRLRLANLAGKQTGSEYEKWILRNEGRLPELEEFAGDAW